MPGGRASAVPGLALLAGVAAAAFAAEPAFYLHDARSSASPRLGSVEVVSRAALIEGKEARYWVLRYYEWLEQNKRKFRYQGIKVQTDTTGSLCGSLQSGPVWFLTNFQWGKVTRTCEIPANVHVLIPVLEVLTAPARGMTVACGELTSAARKMASEDAQVSLAIDGRQLAEVRDYEGATGCLDRGDPDDPGRKQTVAMHGFWVFLKPLPPGTHRLEFSGRPARHNYAAPLIEIVHDVAYEITVKQ